MKTKYLYAVFVGTSDNRVKGYSTQSITDVFLHCVYTVAVFSLRVSTAAFPPKIHVAFGSRDYFLIKLKDSISTLLSHKERAN